MNESVMLYTPIILAILMGLAADLQVLAEDASEKTSRFAGNAVAAIDCAYQATPLTDCSPELFNEDFSEEIEQTNQLLQQAIEAGDSYSISEQPVQ